MRTCVHDHRGSTATFPTLGNRAKLIEQRRKDKRFIRLLEENLAGHQRLLEALRDRDGGP